MFTRVTLNVNLGLLATLSTEKIEAFVVASIYG